MNYIEFTSAVPYPQVLSSGGLMVVGWYLAWEIPPRTLGPVCFVLVVNCTGYLLVFLGCRSVGRGTWCPLPPALYHLRVRGHTPRYST